MFKKTAAFLKAHPLARHFFFLLLAVLTVFINGYHFGTFDQVFHITFLKKFVSPVLYPNDPFLSLRWYHFSFFWFFFIPFLKAGLLEISMFIIHILTVYGTIWMFWAISDLLFKNAQANLLISIALVFPHIGFPGFQIIEFSLLNRTFVLPFLLGSIWLYLKGKRHLAFLMVGLMFNLHVIYSAFVLCMFLLNEVITISRGSWWKPFLHLLIFTAAGLPVLIWRMQTGDGIDLTLRPEMLDLAADGLLYTVYYPVGKSTVVLGNFLAGAGTIWAFVLGIRQAPKSPRHRNMRNFVIAIAVLFIIAMFVSYLLPVTILLQMQILRVGIFMLYFGMLYFSNFICQKKSSHQLSAGGSCMLALSFVLLITPLLSVLFWYLAKGLSRVKAKQGWFIPVVCAVQVLTVFTAVQSGFWAPGISIFGPQSDWRDVQDWAKENTSTDTLFITPPHIFWHYTPDWRVFSERSSVVTIPEMMEIPFDPAFTESFLTRFEAVAPGAVERFSGDYIETLAITENAFYANNAEHFREIACEFSADFLVVEQGHPYDLDSVYENNGFIVYQLPECP